MSRALLIRLDKIGDVTLTLPIDRGLKESGVDVTWFLHPSVRFLVEQGLQERHAEFMTAEWSPKNFLQCYKRVRNLRPDVAVQFWGPWWVALAVWCARVPIRVGRLSQWYSFLFFNRGERQSRSLSEKHESEYGWDLRQLVWPADLKSPRIRPYFQFRKILRRHLLEKWQLQPSNYVVVHPGMAGSALNWPHFPDLISRLVEQKETVVITGTAADKAWTEPLRTQFERNPQTRWTVGQLEIEDLLFLLQNARAVVAPSTGVAHLAASCGVPLVALYSPVRVHHPDRWRPLGPNVKVLLPENGVGDGASSTLNPMSAISVERVLHELAQTP